MKTEEFWDKFINEDILQIFDITYDFFSNPLPEDFVEEYDVNEVILETTSCHCTAKNFDNVLKFIELLRNKHPDLYKENYEYLDDFLIEYYCFHSDREKVSESFSNFIEDPIHGIDQYLLVFKKILFYQYTELLEQAISRNFDIISNSNRLIGIAEYDLGICKFYMILQEIYKDNNESMDKVAFLRDILKFGFKLNAEKLSALENGILKPQIEGEILRESFIKNIDNLIFTLKGYFLRYMFKKGFEFYLSGILWDNMLVYWIKNKNSAKKTDDFFKIDQSPFEKYLVEISGDMFVDNKSEMIATLWGSVYIYDFLDKYNIISENIYNNFITISRKLKGIVINQFTSDLWNFNFVHCWERPDSISETEFVEEHSIFKKSIFFKHEDFSELKNDIPEELSKIGELSEYILDSGDKQEKDDLKPNEKKVGRNEPCPCGSGMKYKKCCGK